MVSQTSDARIVELRETSQYRRWRGSVTCDMTHNSINLFLWHIVRKETGGWERKDIRAKSHRGTLPDIWQCRSIVSFLSFSLCSDKCSFHSHQVIWVEPWALLWQLWWCLNMSTSVRECRSIPDRSWSVTCSQWQEVFSLGSYCHH